MCGRYTDIALLSALAERFKFPDPKWEKPPRYNVAPSQQNLVVINSSSGREARRMQWGLVPSWAKEVSIGYKMINARAETLAHKPSFKKPLIHHRCLVLADGFYEWREAKTGKGKIPMRFVLKNREPFAFAGLYDIWKKPDGTDLLSYTIVTTEANQLISELHDRMPVILNRKTEDKWLDPEIKDHNELRVMLTPYPGEEMEIYDVSPLVNSPKNDVPACIEPV